VAIVLAVLGVAVILGGAWLWTPDKDRTQLEARYAGAPSTFVTAAGVRLHVRDSGPLDNNKDAPVVILLHGFGSSLHTWEAWARGLASTHRVIRFDLPGSGLTGADPTGDYSDARSLQVLGALMDALGVRRASLVGHSMGGRIAWRFAAEHPQRVARLVLVSPDGFASPGFEYGKPPQVPALVRLMQYVLPRPVLRMSLAPAYADPSVMTDALVTRYYDMMLAPTVRSALIARMEQAVLQDPVPMLQRITAPTLLLWGDADAMIPIANAADYLRALPNARLVTLPRVGHIPQEEAPDAALAVVEKFLDQDLHDLAMHSD
jgi:pimeloyl-ACP methyl ester carboxylesterase